MYSNLGEALHSTRTVSQAEKAAGVSMYFSYSRLVDILKEFIAGESGFNTAKRLASELIQEIEAFWKKHIFKGEDMDLSLANFDGEYQHWQYLEIRNKLESLIHVFRAECADVEIYSVDQVLLYKTSDLVASGSNRIPKEIRSVLSNEILREFDNAARCLAFNLPTACGFHSLRALELVIYDYWQFCGGSGEPPSNWGGYVKSLSELESKNILLNDEIRAGRQKVIAMLDRVRDLHRNPLMHPQDNLDVVGADQLFNLSSITIVEMWRTRSEERKTTPAA
jgi:hypothetical protein